MAIPILKNWKNYFDDENEGLGSSYERVVLNRKLQTICKHFAVKNVLEIPSFSCRPRTRAIGYDKLNLEKTKP